MKVQKLDNTTFNGTQLPPKMKKKLFYGAALGCALLSLACGYGDIKLRKRADVDTYQDNGKFFVLQTVNDKDKPLQKLFQIFELGSIIAALKSLKNAEESKKKEEELEEIKRINKKKKDDAKKSD